MRRWNFVCEMDNTLVLCKMFTPFEIKQIACRRNRLAPKGSAIANISCVQN